MQSHRFLSMCKSGECAAVLLIAWIILLLFPPVSTMGATAWAAAPSKTVLDDLAFFGSMKDRSAGAEECERAADYILKSFEEAGLEQVSVQKFLAASPQGGAASIETEGRTFELFPWGPNLAYLPVTPEEGLQGSLIYAGSGSFERFDGKPVQGSVVLMDMDSHGNWMNAAMFGAAAVVFLGDESSTSGTFRDKESPTPVAFPRYWAPKETGERLKEIALSGAASATVKSHATWQNKMLRNCYGLLPGKDPKLKEDLIVLDAFYDASSPVLGVAPGADEATSISVMLHLARELAQNRPERSVLFLATVGNGQGMSGVRQFIWAGTTRKKLLRKDSKDLQTQKEQIGRQMALIDSDDPLEAPDPADRDLVWQVAVEQAKNRADALTREIQYRKLTGQTDAGDVEDARPYRRLSWLSAPEEMSAEQRPLALKLLKESRQELRASFKELKQRYDVLKSTSSLRSVIDEHRPVLFLNLHLSSHSPKLGLMEMGESYPIRETVKRTVRAARLAELLGRYGSEIAVEAGLPNVFDRGAGGGSADSGAERPHIASHLCCDVGALAGLPAVSIMTFDDNRSLWSTPHDTLERVSQENIVLFARFLPELFRRAFSYPTLHSATDSGIQGLASLEGQAKFIRQGELFPDQPAPGTIISVIQGDSVFRAMVYRDGKFFIPGLANRRVALEKLILEPYGLDPKTGRVAWTADKAQTRKDNYRIKVKSDLATTSLVMFHCLQTDVIGAFNPLNLSYLTRVELLDAATEATPLRYWYSRVDGRNTMSVSVFLEKGTRFKMIMAESLLRRELLLLNSSPDDPTGKGFPIGSPETVALAPYQVARDMHTLVGGRLQNLFRHGIMNRYLEELYQTAGEELDRCGRQISSASYGAFWENAVSAWARLNIVYSEIEGSQRDVLTGVMFFIALFVPFAFCIERYLFCFRSIYQQISAFFGVLIITILIIRALHPAFQLTYSPMVVIIAFFIVGLSLMVSWIIFIRFEHEMADAHNRAAHMKTPQASKWQAFGAGFSIGVSNLNRRKLRTGLTCVTLVILTFTVMSFTNVKSLHKTMRARIADDTAYEGILLRHQFRLPLTLLTLEDMKVRYEGEATIQPRGWVEPVGSSGRSVGMVSSGARTTPAEGILGFGSNPPDIFKSVLTQGRWLEPEEEDAILMPTAMAAQLGLNPARDIDAPVSLLGDRYRVVGYFDGARFGQVKDLDDNPITPAYFEISQSEELSEVEIEAMQSGEVLLPQSEQFRYANGDATVIIPFRKCTEYGGKLKAITIMPHSDRDVLQMADDLSAWLAYPLFVGKDGTWFHSAGSTLRYQGAATLIVPILIVVFITLNTMIGHVHERQREIGTYTSVGLAPTHVGFLFIVEALSLAVISTVIGYILAQLSAKYLGSTAAFSQLTFNYSSLASVACMFLVFSVVFLAALYPARMAAEIAMPDVNRSWDLPPPEGDVLFLNLPFLLKYEEEHGIMGFLNDFYSSHQDVAHGTFIVDQTSLDADVPQVKPGEVPHPVCLLIRTNVWLAPFDFGIKQRLQLHCCPSPENPGYLEIALQMIRISGERSAWVRANKNFIKALRKQMLLWRFLDEEAKHHIVGRCSLENAPCRIWNGEEELRT